jgi:sRNA-binding regulator protein Hfq
MITRERKEVKKETEGPRNYGNPEPLNTSHIGKSVTVTLVNGRIESGKLKALGAYMLSVEDPRGKELIINKGAIITVSVMP